jgi:biotin carboxyl carrier protein
VKYYVRIGDAQYDVTIHGESVTIDGETLRAKIQDLPGTPMQLVTIGESVHRVHAIRGNEKGAYDVSVHGFRFAVEALDERSRAIRELSGGSAKAAGPAHLLAPMPGLIVRVNIGEGDHVRAGQGLVVMEAMKMENELRAPVDAKVKRIMVSAGSAVEKGAMILEMEVAP